MAAKTKKAKVGKEETERKRATGYKTKQGSDKGAKKAAAKHAGKAPNNR